MANKSTRAQLSERVRIIFELLLSGTPRVDIIEYGRKNWGVRRAMADQYIAKANELIKKEAAKIIENAFEDHLVMRDSLRLAALKDGDKRLAHEILRDTAKLLGLYAPKELKVWTRTLPNGTNETEAIKQFQKALNKAREESKVE